MSSEGLQLKSDDAGDGATAFLVDLVSNRKIPITSPRCKVGRDDLNDIVISGDQSISRFHFVITKENGQYMVQDGKSRHGTFLNGNQITIPEPIHDGDVLKVGVSLFWFVIEASANTAPADKFAPVDIELIDQQELEFMEADPEPDEAPAAAAPVSSPLPASATQEVPALTAEKIAGEESKRIAAEETRRSSTVGDTTAAIPILKDEPAGKDESAEKVEAVSKDAPEGSKEAEKSEEPSSSADSEKSQAPIAEAAPDSGTADADSDAFMAMLLDPLQKKPEPKKKDPNDPQNTLVNLDAMKPAEVASAAKLDESKLDESKLDQSKPDQSKPEEPAPGASFTDFGNTEAAVKFTEYQYSETDALTKEPAFPVFSSEPAPAKEPVVEETPLPELVVKAEAPSDEPPDFGKTGELPAPVAKATSSLAGLFGLSEAEAANKAEPHTEPPSTLGKFAEIIGEASSIITEKKEDATSLKSVLNFQSEEQTEEAPATTVSASQEEPQTTNGAKGMSIVKEGASTVPDWCKRYFGTELNQLSKELNELNEQVRLAQQKIKDVEGRVALTKGLRNTLLTAQGEELVEACGKVLTMLGWKVKVSDEDKHELRLETNDEKGVSIARIVWTETQADRTHLGQLSISQTRFWCEQGVEPKGILIVSKNGETAPAPLTKDDRDSELAEYATKKNVCLMTTLQLLSVYKEIALGDGTADAVRSTILNSNGWLSGYNLEPGSEPIEKEESSAGTNKLSSLLSA